MSDPNEITQGDPTIIGDLLPEELQKLAELRNQSEQILRQLGLNRLGEQRLLQQMQITERNAQMVLNQAGARLGIAEGTPWQVTGEGKAIMVGPPPVPSPVKPNLKAVPDPSQE